MKPLLKSYGPVVLGSVALALAFPTWNLYPLAWVALVPLLWRTRDATPRAAFGCFLLAGWVFNSLLLQWLVTNIYWAGGWAVWGQQGLCLVLALFWAVTGAAWVHIRRKAPRLGGTFGFAVLWGAMEFSQAHLFSGFGWGALGYSQGKDLWLSQWAAVGGVSLVSMILAGFNALIALALPGGTGKEPVGPIGRIRRIGLAIALDFALFLVAHVVGAAMLATPDYESKPFRVGVLQPDFPLEMKWDWEYKVEMVRNMASKSRELEAAAPVDLFVWPETAIMDDVDKPEIADIVQGLARDTATPLFTGSQRTDPETRGDRNSSHLIDAEGNIVGSYDKIHLAPFGEYVPYGKYLPFLRRIIPAMSDIEPGHTTTTFETGGRRFGPLICFEVLFADLAENLRKQGADFLIVITNLGWFGASNGIPQEFELGRFRAIETRLPIVHSANTGISGVFDPWGRFSLVTGIFDVRGRYLPFRREVAPAETVMQRVAGALPLAAPGSRPLPGGPHWIPRLSLVGGILAVAYATLGTKRT